MANEVVPNKLKKLSIFCYDNRFVPFLLKFIVLLGLRDCGQLRYWEAVTPVRGPPASRAALSRATGAAGDRLVVFFSVPALASSPIDPPRFEFAR